MVENVTQSLLKKMDVLLKWLGPESKKFTRSIRGSNISDPDKGLSRIWKCLDDCYGRPEMNEYTLRNKLNRLPKISMKNPKMLYDLLDFLKESAKENEQYATLLSYYDSYSGVSPIIRKLP